VSRAKKAQKSAHFAALEKEMKSKIERLKTEKKRLEDDVVALQGCLVSCEETFCGANKRIQYLKKSKDCTFLNFFQGAARIFWVRKEES